MITLADLNRLDRDAFIATLADIFEHSPWVAEEAFPRRPFASITDLHAAMVGAVTNAAAERQLTLLRAHPELAGKAAVQGTLTDHSTSEQGGSGLLNCSPDEFARLQELNRAYGQRFGFPFIIAVRGLDRAGIIAAFAQRLENTRDEEMAEALRQVAKIGRLRLDALIEKTA
jgi:2-oxo-4-hydroxy-4-carboxy-5-ureidoimidazoline decarboxylase